MMAPEQPFEQAREREIAYHNALYREHSLFEKGSWLYRSVQYVLDSFQYIPTRKKLRALDIGGGVGRHSIPLAQYLDNDSEVICLDMLPSAIALLQANAEKQNVGQKVVGVVADIESYPLENDSYDYVVSVSCIEHVSTKEQFVILLERIQRATRDDGVNCFCIITDNVWLKADTNEAVEPLIEVNLSCDETQRLLKDLYRNWDVVDMSTKSWSTPEQVGGENVSFQSTCLQFLAVKRPA